MRLNTGTAKIRCAFGKCAMTTQQTGMVMAPTMKAHEAMPPAGPDRDKFCVVSQNSRFTAPRPKNEMWPSRYIRRLKLP